MFFKRKAPQTLSVKKSFCFPVHRALELLSLHDEIINNEGNAAARYKLWTIIHELFPETKDTHLQWSIDVGDATRPRVVGRG